MHEVSPQTMFSVAPPRAVNLTMVDGDCPFGLDLNAAGLLRLYVLANIAATARLHFTLPPSSSGPS